MNKKEKEEKKTTENLDVPHTQKWDENEKQTTNLSIALQRFFQWKMNNNMQHFSEQKLALALSLSLSISYENMYRELWKTIEN